MGPALGSVGKAVWWFVRWCGGSACRLWQDMGNVSCWLSNCSCTQQTQLSYSRLASSTFQSGAAHILSSSHLEPLRTLPAESKQCERQVQPRTQPCHWATAVEQQHPLPKVSHAFLENQISSKQLPKQRSSPIWAATHRFFLQKSPVCPEAPAGASSQPVHGQGVWNIPVSPNEA